MPAPWDTPCKSSYKSPSQMSYLGRVDVHAGDEVDIGIEEVL